MLRSARRLIRLSPRRVQCAHRPFALATQVMQQPSRTGLPIILVGDIHGQRTKVEKVRTQRVLRRHTSLHPVWTAAIHLRRPPHCMSTRERYTRQLELSRQPASCRSGAMSRQPSENLFPHPPSSFWGTLWTEAPVRPRGQRIAPAARRQSPAMLTADPDTCRHAGCDRVVANAWPAAPGPGAPTTARASSLAVAALSACRCQRRKPK